MFETIAPWRSSNWYRAPGKSRVIRSRKCGARYKAAACFSRMRQRRDLHTSAAHVRKECRASQATVLRSGLYKDLTEWTLEQISLWCTACVKPEAGECQARGTAQAGPPVQAVQRRDRPSPVSPAEPAALSRARCCRTLAQIIQQSEICSKHA